MDHGILYGVVDFIKGYKKRDKAHNRLRGLYGN